MGSSNDMTTTGSRGRSPLVKLEQSVVIKDGLLVLEGEALLPCYCSHVTSIYLSRYVFKLDTPLCVIGVILMAICCHCRLKMVFKYFKVKPRFHAIVVT